MSLSTTTSRDKELKIEGQQLKDYLQLFLSALKPIVLAATGTTFELDMARAFLSTKSPKEVARVYKRHMLMDLDGKPVWYHIAVKDEELLVKNPQLVIGMDMDHIKRTTQLWLSALSPEQKATVWQWTHGMLMLVGFDIAEAVEEHELRSQERL